MPASGVPTVAISSQEVALSGSARSWRPVLALALGLALVALGGPAGPAAAAAPGVAQPAVATGPVPQRAAPLAPGPARAFAPSFACQIPTSTVHCYGPAQVRHAYGIDTLLDGGLTGAGRTVVVVDAFQSPTVREDLTAFEDVFGLPPADLTVSAPYGLTPFDQEDPVHLAWATQISLDVQWVHAVAPGARVHLVLAPAADDRSLQRTVAWAVDQDLGDVLTQSWVRAERCYGLAADGTALPGVSAEELHEVYERAAERGTSVLAAAGDTGSTQPTCDGSARVLATALPAADPLVTAVGGTKLYADLGTGRYRGEQVRDEEADFGPGAVGGGGFSALWPRPAYQDGVGDLPSRGVPDVAYDAATDRGFVVALSGSTTPAPSFYVVGGTGGAAAQWAGLAALAGQARGSRLGPLNPALYALAAATPSAFHDITRGSNGADGRGGYGAGRGWDAASGLGSPVAQLLVPALAAAG